MNDPDDGIRADRDKRTDSRRPVQLSGSSYSLPHPDDAGSIDSRHFPGSGYVSVMILCFLAVIVTSPFNLILLFFSWSLIERSCGGYAADNSPGLLYFLAGTIQTALFAVLWFPVFLMTRKRSSVFQIWSIVALTIVYLGSWTAWIIWLAAEMTRTDNWP